MSDDKVSVIIPVYNVQNFLAKCLDSIVNQSLRELQIILVSDGPEECNAICEEYAQKDSRIEIIYNINKGLGGARNAGIEASKAPYIMFVDSDDWIESDMCQKLYDAINNNPVDIAVCGINVVFHDVKETHTAAWEIKYQGLLPIKRNIFNNMNLEIWNKIYKKSIIDKYNFRFLENFYAEDSAFIWPYLTVSSGIYFIKDKLYNYLKREGSLTEQAQKKAFGKKAIDPIKAGEHFYKHLKDYNIFKKYEKIFLDMYFNCCHIAMLFSQEEVTKEVKHKIHDFLNIENIKIPNNYKFDFIQDIKIAPNYQINSIKIFPLWKNLPIMAIKKYHDKENWLLFGKILIFSKNLLPQKNKTKNKKIMLYGAGIFAEKMLTTYDFSALNILGILDINPDKENTCINEYKIFHTSKIKQLNPDIIILCVANEQVVYSKLIEILIDEKIKVTVVPYLFNEFKISNNIEATSFDVEKNLSFKL